MDNALIPLLVWDSAITKKQWWAKWRFSTFDLYPWGEGHGVQGQICDILRPQLAMNCFLLLWPHRFSHFGCINLGGGGVGGLWYYIDVEHSTYLQVSMPTSAKKVNITWSRNSVVDNTLIPLLVWDTAIPEKVNFTWPQNSVVDSALLRPNSHLQRRLVFEANLYS